MPITKILLVDDEPFHRQLLGSQAVPSREWKAWCAGIIPMPAADLSAWRTRLESGLSGLFTA